jgi:hypothetical protein
MNTEPCPDDGEQSDTKAWDVYLERFRIHISMERWVLFVSTDGHAIPLLLKWKRLAVWIRTPSIPCCPASARCPEPG